jgi:hypothetical protein
MAQADSPLSSTKGWDGYDFPTQEARGMAYTAYLRNLFALRSSDGVHPMLGIDWWAWTDKVVGGERNNFGLTTYHDNAYDGKEAVRAPSRDAAGYATGGELRDYGNFLGSVTQANLRQEWKPPASQPARDGVRKK